MVPFWAKKDTGYGTASLRQGATLSEWLNGVSRSQTCPEGRSSVPSDVNIYSGRVGATSMSPGTVDGVSRATTHPGHATSPCPTPSRGTGGDSGSLPPDETGSTSVLGLKGACVEPLQSVEHLSV